VIGVGTKNGAPLRNETGDFVRDSNGSVVVPKVNIAQLRALAKAGGGVSSLLTRSAQDIEAVFQLSEGLAISNPDTESGSDSAELTPVADYWVEYGVWVLPILLLLALGLLRRGLVI